MVFWRSWRKEYKISKSAIIVRWSNPNWDKQWVMEIKIAFEIKKFQQNFYWANERDIRREIIGATKHKYGNVRGCWGLFIVKILWF